MNYLATLLQKQLDAALHTLGYCIGACEDAEWQEAHGDYPFSQVVFHTLFYTDLYLGRDTIPFKQQPFHINHPKVFRDYEELERRVPVCLYEKAFCQEYLAHCLGKVATVLSSETEITLAAASGISFRKGCRAELHVYNIRHIQHHAAQLGLRLQLLTNKEMPWFSGGA
ncbi:MAG: hypothetical protein CVV52_08560 [Spirochaetae bacterium HGW-Spirochaetae-8]|nr:MAG: hypothetical protein CVV52_08560 [Spirochaetae bacterium HGW-Spirochaetae-8]